MAIMLEWFFDRKAQSDNLRVKVCSDVTFLGSRTTWF